MLTLSPVNNKIKIASSNPGSGTDEFDEIARQHCRCGGVHGSPYDLPTAAAAMNEAVAKIRSLPGVISVAVNGELVYVKVTRSMLCDLANISGPEMTYNTDHYSWDFAGNFITPFRWTGTHKIGEFRSNGIFYQADIQTLLETY